MSIILGRTVIFGAPLILFTSAVKLSYCFTAEMTEKISPTREFKPFLNFPSDPDPQSATLSHNICLVSGAKISAKQNQVAKVIGHCRNAPKCSSFTFFRPLENLVARTGVDRFALRSLTGTIVSLTQRLITLLV